MDEEYAIQLEHIRKEFPGIVANDDISINLKKGEIHALLGENGAGKSTLMSILSGIYQPTSGVIKVNGKEEKISNPNIANDLGIGMVHQHFQLVEVFTVLENIILGFEPVKHGFIKKAEARKKVIDLIKQYGFDLDVDAKIEDINVSMQQKTEILKLLYKNNDILIFDEPTAVLTPQEIEDLLRIIKDLAKEGKSILFISHKLNEIMEVADTCTILRRGKQIATLNVKDTNPEELSMLMVGREVATSYDKAEQKIGESVLKVRNLIMEDKIHKGVNAVNDVSFDVKKGEIVTIAGIDGNGQTELIYGITGNSKEKSGSIYLNDIDVTNKSIFERNKIAIAHIPEDRQKMGLVLDFSLENNYILEEYYKPKFNLYKNTKDRNSLNIQDPKAINEYSEELIEKYDVRSSQGSKSTARSMSGGNQQKAIIAREIERDKDLIIAVQPTRGLDVGAIENIHKQLLEQRYLGKAILVVSYELEEVLSISDRILVMFKGQIVGELNPVGLTKEEIGLYMSGAKSNYNFIEKENNLNE